MRARASFLALSLALAPAALAGAIARPAAAEDPPGAALTGSYRFVGGQRERDAIREAIEDATADMLPGIRTLARTRLEESNPATDRVEIRVTSSLIKIDHVGFRSLTAPASGMAIPWKSGHGDRVKVTHKIVAGKLVQRLVGDDGGRENTYVLGGDGQKLAIRTRIWSKRLPKEVQYTLSYARE
jgi:hypothetical protein